jgi:hypothetical protein
MSNFVLYIHLVLGLLVLGAISANTLQKHRGLALSLISLAALTGAYNFMTRMTGAPKGWHALVGIKVLLALHAIAMVMLLARGNGDDSTRARWRKGALISGSLATVLGLYVSNVLR